MKKIFTIALTFIAITCCGQQWIDYRLDSTMTVVIPDNYRVVDTMGLRVITAQSDNGLVLVTKLANKGHIAINVQNETELIKSYTGFQEGLIGSHKGTLIESEIIDRAGGRRDKEARTGVDRGTGHRCFQWFAPGFDRSGSGCGVIAR